MNFKETLSGLIRPSLRPQHPALRAAVEEARRAKFAEDYVAAMTLFERAEAQARTLQDTAAVVEIRLHESEIFMRQGRFDDADSRLQRLLQDASDDTQRAYIYTLIGRVAQARGDWAAAHTAYERALDDARAAGFAGAEGRALGDLGDTYLHDHNASYAAHVLTEALPKLADDPELTSYFTGLLGQAMIQNGQDSEGQHLLDSALKIAEQMNYRVYERYWAAVLAERALNEGRYQDAYAYCGHALRLFAPETNSPDYVRAVCQMSKACLSLRSADEALSYAQIALKSATQLENDPLIRMAQGALGVALRSTGNSSDAIPHLEAAAQVEHPQIDVLRSLAAAQVGSGDTAGAIATYQRAIQQAGAANLRLEQAQARRDLGLVYQSSTDLLAAIGEWSAALTIYDEHRAFGQVARLYCDIGSARKQLGHRVRAMRDYGQALMTLNSLNEADQETRGLVLSNAANAYAEHGDAKSADAFFTEAIAIAERLGDQVAEFTRNGNYGWFLLLVGRPRRALATLERALEISQRLDLTLPRALQLDNLGLVYDSLNDLPAALDHHRRALALVNDPAWAAHIKVNLADVLITMSNLDEAQTLLDEALTYSRQVNQSEVIIMALITRSRLLLVRQQPEAADDLLTEAITLARKIDHRRLLAESLSLRSEQQAALGRSGEAAWEEAQRLYLILHMPKGKIQPAWLPT